MASKPNDEMGVLEGPQPTTTPIYPKNHKPAMRVPRGGSMCANCEYLKDREKGLCGEPNFIKWNGSNKIPAPIDCFCSDWYEPKKGAVKSGKSE